MTRDRVCDFVPAVVSAARDGEMQAMSRMLLVVLALTIWVAVAAAQSLPPSPQDIRVSLPLSGQARVVLSWSSEDGPWSFRVYRSATDSLHFGWIAHVSGEQYTDLNIQPLVKYYYYVTSVDSVGQESAPSRMISVTTRDSVLPPSGVVTGRVVDDSTSRSIRGVLVRFFTTTLQAAETFLGSTITDSVGQFTVQVDTGTYLVRFASLEDDEYASHYAIQWYNGADGPSAATPILVGAGDTVAVSARLHKSPQIQKALLSGVVSDSLQHGLANAEVAVMRNISELASALPDSEDASPFAEIRDLPGLGYIRGVVWSGSTDSTGHYIATIPRGGPYMVMAWAGGYFIQLYRDQSDPTRATLLTVTNDTSGIDFHLLRADSTGNSVQGGLRDSSGNGVAGRVILFPRPISGITITPALYVNTNSAGSFALQNIPTGSYTILGIPYSDYAPAYYRSGRYDVEQWSDAESLHVQGALANITVGVRPLVSPGASTINGAVSTPTGDAVIGGRIVFSSQSTGMPIAFGVTDGSGRYSIAGIPAGALTVVVDQPPFLSASAALEMPANVFSLGNVNFVLDPLASIRGTGDGVEPGAYSLQQNYPNPFNPSTVISGQWPVTSVVRLAVYDVLGRQVALLANGSFPAGKYTFTFHGNTLASGVYFYRLQAGSFSQTRSMLLVK